MSLKVKIGDQVPSVGLRASDGYLLNLRSLVGKQPAIVLFFGAPTRELVEAIKGAGTRALGDGWCWSRKSSRVDISPLVASTLALWACAGLS